MREAETGVGDAISRFIVYALSVPEPDRWIADGDRVVVRQGTSYLLYGPDGQHAFPTLEDARSAVAPAELKPLNAS